MASMLSFVTYRPGTLADGVTDGCTVIEPVEMAPSMPEEIPKIDEASIKERAAPKAGGEGNAKIIESFTKERNRAVTAIGQLRTVHTSAVGMLDASKSYIKHSQDFMLKQQGNLLSEGRQTNGAWDASGVVSTLRGNSNFGAPPYPMPNQQQMSNNAQ